MTPREEFRETMRRRVHWWRFARMKILPADMREMGDDLCALAVAFVDQEHSDKPDCAWIAGSGFKWEHKACRTEFLADCGLEKEGTP